MRPLSLVLLFLCMIIPYTIYSDALRTHETAKQTAAAVVQRAFNETMDDVAFYLGQLLSQSSVVQTEDAPLTLATIQDIVPLFVRQLATRLQMTDDVSQRRLREHLPVFLYVQPNGYQVVTFNATTSEISDIQPFFFKKQGTKFAYFRVNDERVYVLDDASPDSDTGLPVWKTETLTEWGLTTKQRLTLMQQTLQTALTKAIVANSRVLATYGVRSEEQVPVLPAQLAETVGMLYTYLDAFSYDNTTVSTAATGIAVVEQRNVHAANQPNNQTTVVYYNAAMQQLYQGCTTQPSNTVILTPGMLRILQQTVTLQKGQCL